MGPAKMETPSPEKFLRKHSKEPQLPEKKPFTYMDGDGQRKPPVPARNEQPKMGIYSAKNYIRDNAIKNALAIPKRPQPIYADTKRGDKQPLECSGLVPKYSKKKDYGQTPEYLQQRKEEERRAQEEYDEYVKERLRQGAMKQLSDEERLSTLQGLKRNWEELHHQYQALSIVTDTGPKKYHKERLEQQMKQLEKDIDLIERHKTIYKQEHKNKWYISKFREQVKQEKQMGKSSHRTMGLPGPGRPSPEKFLRKHSKEPKLADNIVPFSEENLRRKPISTRPDNSWMRTPSKNNFVKSNAVDNILSAPRRPQACYAFTKNGDKQPLETSGLVPKYVHKKDYGQTPEYLQQRKEEERRAQEEYDEYVKERLRQGAMKQLSDEERLSTLQGLKKNWEEIHHQYQCLSIVTDT
ncbi:hypothetical protein JZ751_022022, partial [Albula glossodonta]